MRKLKLQVQISVDGFIAGPHGEMDWMTFDWDEAISQYVEREEKREAFRQDAIDAWNEYQASGLHVTGDEVMAWLDTWGEESEQAAPLCHK